LNRRAKREILALAIADLIEKTAVSVGVFSISLALIIVVIKLVFAGV
tara:strand:+ start:1188 stop:1328 length:141 start_codon:yes stop_codon:yes gene_type:complete